MRLGPTSGDEAATNSGVERPVLTGPSVHGPLTMRRYTRSAGRRDAAPLIPEALLNPRFFRNGIVMLLLVVVALAVVITVLNQTAPSRNVGYSQFLANVAADNVAKVEQQGTTLTVTPKDNQPPYTVVVPGILGTQVLPDMQAAADKANVKLSPDILTA